VEWTRLWVIGIDFTVQDLLSFFYLSDVVPRTGSQKVILQPSIGTLYFAFCLSRKCINDVNLAVPEHLFPLRIWETVFSTHEYGCRRSGRLPDGHTAAVVIKRGNQPPFALSGRGKQVYWGIMLDEFSCIAGQHLPVMHLFLLMYRLFFFARSIMVGTETPCLCCVKRRSLI